MISRRQFTQTTFALAVTPILAKPGLAVAGTVDLQRDSIAAAIVQSRAQSTPQLAAELHQVLQHGRKDLVCFPALENIDVSALHQRQAYVAVNDTLITPHGEILSGRNVYDTDIGHIAFVKSLSGVAPDAEILIHLSSAPVSFTKAQSLATRHAAHVIAATPVGDSFLQATGSVIFSPAGEVLSAAGAAWTQTLAATLHIAHWRGQQARDQQALV